MLSPERCGGGQGLEHPGQPRLAPTEPPGSPSPRRPQRAGEAAAQRAWKGVGKPNRLLYSQRHSTPPSRFRLSSQSPQPFPSALCSDPGTPRGAPAQMERKEGSEARARKEPPRLPAIAQTPGSRADDMPRGLRAWADQVASSRKRSQRISATTSGRRKQWGAKRVNVPAQGPGDPGAGNARPTLSSSLLGRRHYRCQRLLPATSVFVQCKIKKKKLGVGGGGRKAGAWGRKAGRKL